MKDSLKIEELLKRHRIATAEVQLLVQTIWLLVKTSLMAPVAS